MKPIYLQIADEISERIKNNEMKPNELIPSESKLALEYGVSKMTVRQGLSILNEAGYIKPVPGKGYFVERPRFDMFSLRFSEKDIVLGYEKGVKILDVKIIDPEEEHPELPPLQLGVKSVLLKRILLNSEDQPAAYDIKVLPYDRGKPIVEKEIYNASLPEMVAEHGELFSIKNDMVITAGYAEGEIASKLRVNQGSSLLIIEQKLFSVNNRPMGWGKTYCNPEKFQIEAVSSQYVQNKVFMR